ncbi:hypothetical protein O181_039350 [Austropuccinia psidii MF-1]|uniref:Uncharacterized protein n=1 Tax=Austropuccinia psidii MF-1 TaxID=1389203 RepID=A0A9Q3DBF5_9BASI|nr:hypothetical protein [Austropuccinia psidii MF-1]
MSSKLTELTGSSPSEPPPSVLYGSGILSQFSSTSMASSGHFDPTQAYDSYKAIEVLDPACTAFLSKGKDFFEHYKPRSSKFHYCFIGKKPCSRTWKQASNIGRQRDVARWANVGGAIPVGGRPIYSSSAVPISRINTESLVKWIRRVADYPSNLDSECTDELDCEEVEVVNNSIGHESSTSPCHPFSKVLQSHIIPSTPKTFQTTLSPIPNSLPPTPGLP